MDGQTRVVCKYIALVFATGRSRTENKNIQLEDLYVSPEYRNLGVGKALFGHLGRVAEENDCPRLDWAVLKVPFLS